MGWAQASFLLFCLDFIGLCLCIFRLSVELCAMCDVRHASRRDLLLVYLIMLLSISLLSMLISRGSSSRGGASSSCWLIISCFVCCHHSPKRGRLKEHLLVLVI